MSIIGNKIKLQLADRGGSGQIWTIVILLIALMTLSFLMEGLRVFNQAMMVREAVEQAIISAAADNAYNAYAGIREGNATPYTPDGSGWRLAVETSDVVAQIINLHNLRRSGNSFYKEAGGQEQWSIHGLQVTALPPDIRSDNSTLLRFEAAYTIHIPVRYLGELKGTFRRQQTAKSSYIPLH